MENLINAEETFLQAVQNERDAFCNFINEHFPLIDRGRYVSLKGDNICKLRTAAESLLIMFDQLAQKEKERENPNLQERNELYKKLIIALAPGKKMFDKIDRQSFVLQTSHLADLAMTEIKKGAI